MTWDPTTNPSTAHPAPPHATWRRVVGLVLVAAVAGVAGWGFHRVFPGLELLKTVAPAATVPAVVAAITWRRPLWLALVLDVVLWFAATIPLYGGVNPAMPRDLVNSWQALLTTLLPAQPEPRLLILAHTLVWVAAVIGAETLTRTRTRVAAALPALAVYGVALLLGVDGDGDNLVPTAAILVLVAALAMVRDERPPGWLLAGAPAAAVLAAAASVVGPLLPIAAEPYNPRRNVELPPPIRVDSVSPLDRVSAWLQIPDRELFTVQADKPLNWRLAVLDHYDGVRWTSSARFQPTGGRVPEGEWTGRSATVQQTITVDGLPGTWLPAAERPVEVSGVHGLAVDPTSGALLAGTKPVKGFRYEVTSRVAQPSRADLLAAAPVNDPSLTTFPPGPQEALFRKLAQQATKGADVPIKQAYLLQNYLRANATYDVTAPPGHSLKGLEFFMETTHRGTSEQFAATYALMARTLGLPSRVVVGFRPGQPVNGVYHVKSGHVMAWAEIKFEKLGWRPFFPTPGRSGAKDDHDVVSSAIEESEELAGEFTQGTENKPKDSSHPVGAQAKDTAGGTPLWLIAPAAGAAILLVYGGAALALPWWRRRRRRNVAGAEQRALGAWQQTCDDLGLKEQNALTAEEVVARHPGDISTHLQPLADISNFVRYAPEDVATEAADEAWRRSDAVRVAVRRQTPLKHRLRRRLLLK
ncbi:transglutaminaseTgpA domain-containing protein [Nonomuraea sp. NPDC050536]|uniref:transglutaminase family protein n=1 Tax=Nonomuraea sp. NPDC050536 TaxID=3364366 RepID=UPI0037C7CBC4